MAALSRFGLTILIAGIDSCCGDEDRAPRDTARPPNQRKRAVFVGCWAPQGVKETLVRLKMPRSLRLDPITAGRLSWLILRFGCGNTWSPRPHSQEALETDQTKQLHHLLRLVQPG